VLWPRPASEGDSAICGAVDNRSTKQLAGAGGGAAVLAQAAVLASSA